MTPSKPLPSRELLSGIDTRDRFKDRVKQWREEAILQAVAELLTEHGCQHLTMDDVAKRVGIAKGSLYLHTNARSDLVAQVLDRWLAEIPTPDQPDDIPQGGRWPKLLDALFTMAARGDQAHAAAFPCCLYTSPCPNGWTERWERLAEAYALERDTDNGTSRLSVEVTGEAVQALAAMPTVRSLLRERRLAEARDVIQRFVSSYRTMPQERDAPSRGAP